MVTTFPSSALSLSFSRDFSTISYNMWLWFFLTMVTSDDFFVNPFTFSHRNLTFMFGFPKQVFSSLVRFARYFDFRSRIFFINHFHWNFFFFLCSLKVNQKLKSLEGFLFIKGTIFLPRRSVYRLISMLKIGPTGVKDQEKGQDIEQHPLLMTTSFVSRYLITNEVMVKW